MTEADFLALLADLSQQYPVQASDALEGNHDVEIGDTVVCVQFIEQHDTLALTVPLPPIDLPEDAAPEPLTLYRLVLLRQWQDSLYDGVYFGVLPLTNELVGMVALAGDDIAGPDDLRETLKAALVAVETAWYETAAQWLTDNARSQRHKETLPADSHVVLRA